MRKIAIFVFSLLLVSTFAVFAAPDGEDPQGAVTQSGFPRSETVFAKTSTGRIGLPGNYNVWAGWRNPDQGIQQLMTEHLWILDFSVGKIINALTSGPPVYSDDFTQLTINLRSGVYWSDGERFNADDVVFTILTLRDNEGMAFKATLANVTSATATNDTTVVVELSEPNARFHTVFLERWGSLHIMPEHIFAPVAAQGADALLSFEYSEPVSTGPYVLHSFDPTGFWTAWVKRDDWERTPTGQLYGEPLPEYVVYVVYEETTVQILDHLNHQLDQSEMSFDESMVVLEQSEHARAYQREFPFTLNGIDAAVGGPTFNTLLPPFDNTEVRWALTLAIDMVSYNLNTLGGTGQMNPTHMPLTPLAAELYYKPMEPWLLDFTLDIEIDGEPFKPYSIDRPQDLADAVADRGHPLPDKIRSESTFGYGWWKYAPDAAAKLLEKNGFSQDSNGKWLLPDGTPWKFDMLTVASPGRWDYTLAFGVAQEWRKFGIDVETIPSDLYGTKISLGQFEVSSQLPSYSWGAHADPTHVFNWYRSEAINPVLGEATFGGTARWGDPRLDAVIAKNEVIDWNDTDAIVENGIEGLKIMIEGMPTLPLITVSKSIVWDEYYWTNWPGAENSYSNPMHHFGNYKYLLTQIEPTGR
jgi:peptide/nickel transport system substrate-binding protein